MKIVKALLYLEAFIGGVNIAQKKMLPGIICIVFSWLGLCQMEYYKRMEDAYANLP